MVKCGVFFAVRTELYVSFTRFLTSKGTLTVSIWILTLWSATFILYTTGTNKLSRSKIREVQRRKFQSPPMDTVRRPSVSQHQGMEAERSISFNYSEKFLYPILQVSLTRYAFIHLLFYFKHGKALQLNFPCDELRPCSLSPADFIFSNMWSVRSGKGLCCKTKLPFRQNMNGGPYMNH
jgi:hypothetical protein